MSVEIFNCEQNTPEWEDLRRGLVTASELDTVIAQGRKKGEPSVTRRRYLMRLAAERCGAAPAESYTNSHMERGHLLEGDAKNLYSFMTDEEPEPVGFIRNGEMGCSPDSLVRDTGLLEVKTKLPHIQLEVILSGQIPPEHIPQIQGQMWIAEREFVDFVSFWPGLPLFVRRIHRDEPYIRKLSDAVDAFNAELAETVERVRRYSGSPGADLHAALVASLQEGAAA